MTLFYPHVRIRKDALINLLVNFVNVIPALVGYVFSVFIVLVITWLSEFLVFA